MEAMKCLCVVAALLLCGCTLWCGVNGETCTQTGTPCQCQLGDGRKMDITGISTTPKFRSFPDAGGRGYVYAYGPCGQDLNNGADCVTGNKPGGCQNSGSWFNLGKTDQLAIDVNTAANPLTSTWSYNGGSDGRSFVVKITCDPHQTPGNIVDVGEHPALRYNFAVKSSVGCLAGGNPPTEATTTTTTTTTSPPPPVPVTSHRNGTGDLPSWITLVITLVVLVPLMVIMIALLVLVLQRLGSVSRRAHEHQYTKLSVESDGE